MQGDRAMDVSIVVPVLNEAERIGGVILGLFAQDWQGEIEIIVVDGISEDGTVELVRRLADLAPSGRAVRLLTNERRQIAAGVNLGYSAASFDIVLRLDGHTEPPGDFVSQTVGCLVTKGTKAVVGGRCRVVPGSNGVVARAIAQGVASKFGIGNATYRTLQGAPATPLAVDTVPFGACYKVLWRELGGYDETMLTAEDYDFNYRARKVGCGVWLVPGLEVRYFARTTLLGLWQQYYRYGYWTFVLCRKHGNIPAWRKAVPGALMCTLAVSAIACRPLAVAVAGIYSLLAGIASCTHKAMEGGVLLNLTLLAVFPTIHFAYGLGSLVSAVKPNA